MQLALRWGVSTVLALAVGCHRPVQPASGPRTVAGRCYQFPASYFQPRVPRESAAVVGFSRDTLPSADRRRRPSDGTMRVYAGDPQFDGVRRRRVASAWWMRGPDSVDVVWGAASANHASTTFELKIAGDSLRGTATSRSDVPSAHVASVVAVRVDCPAPP